MIEKGKKIQRKIRENFIFFYFLVWLFDELGVNPDHLPQGLEVPLDFVPESMQDNLCHYLPFSMSVIRK